MPFSPELLGRVESNKELNQDIFDHIEKLERGKNFTIGYQRSGVAVDLFSFPASATHKNILRMKGRTVQIQRSPISASNDTYSVSCRGGSIRAYLDGNNSPSLGDVTCKPEETWLFDFEGFALQITFPESQQALLETDDPIKAKNDLVSPVIRNHEDVRGRTEMRCKWTLHASPEYVEADTLLSSELLNPIALRLEHEGVKACRVVVKDGHVEETEAHYQLMANFGNSDEIEGSQNEITLRMDYSSIDEEENADGFIEITVRLPNDSEITVTELLDQIFFQYDFMMFKYYPTTDIKYSDEGFRELN